MHILDVRGERCPKPLIELRRMLKVISSGEKVEVISDDPSTLRDIPYYCEYAGHQLIIMRDLFATEQRAIFVIQRH